MHNHKQTNKQTNNALTVLQLRNIPVVDTLSRCDTVVQFSSLFVMWKVIPLHMPFG